MFLQLPMDAEATARLYQSDMEQQGFVMNLSRLWAWRPEVCEAFGALRTQLTGNSTLSNRELAVIVCATAARRFFATRWSLLYPLRKKSTKRLFIWDASCGRSGTQPHRACK